MFEERENKPTIINKLSLPLETIGIITGIVLCILQGVGTISIGWFWATFPFWIVLAVDLALIVVVFVIAFIVGLIACLVERHRNKI